MPDVDVLIIGAGHAGLGVAARLTERGREAVLFEASRRVGDTWRSRWASLRLFTPRFINSLPGRRFPDGADPFPGKDEIADYEERYASDRGLAIRLNTRVSRVRPLANGFEVTFAGGTVRARNVIIATGAHQVPRIPAFAARLDTRVRQLHSRDYGTAGVLPPGPVLVVGARNSGAEIASDLADAHEVTVAIGATSTHVPARWRSPAWWRVAQLRSSLFHGWELPGPWPWPIKPPRAWIEVDLARAEREGRLCTAPRAVDAAGDAVRLANGREIRPRTVIWATGFRVDDSWIEVPASGEGGIAVRRHRRGPVPGLYILRANLLASLYWAGLAIAADIARRTRR